VQGVGVGGGVKPLRTDLVVQDTFNPSSPPPRRHVGVQFVAAVVQGARIGGGGVELLRTDLVAQDTFNLSLPLPRRYFGVQFVAAVVQGARVGGGGV